MGTKLCSLPVMLLLSLACSVMFLAASVGGQPPPAGFLSIDCGKKKNYTDDSRTGLPYVTDSGYVDIGEVHKVSQEVQNLVDSYARDLRSFPNGTRNCYTLPSQTGHKYLLRAFFLYGNYDGLNWIPKFDLYVGTNPWDTINSNKTYSTEIITMASASWISVCLVNTGRGVPFISALELRPLKVNLYNRFGVNSSQSLVLLTRPNFGASNTNQILRYPSDIYDRFWEPFTEDEWRKINTTLKVNTNNIFEPPTNVMNTAVRPAMGSSLNFSLKWDIETFGQSPNILYARHFAELQKLTKNQTRLFNISMNDMHRYGPMSPSYLSTSTVYSRRPFSLDKINFSLYEAIGSTLPPIINAFEAYIVKKMTNLATQSEDVNAIIEMRRLYKVKRNWMGDPCAPKRWVWNGLNCSYNDSSNQSRIISLNLSSFGLTGGIPIVLANLKKLQSLDLSNNDLNGSIPNFLSELPHLKVLDLSSNKLSGKIPKSLQERSKSRALNLRVSNNTKLCADNPNQCGKTKRKSLGKIVTIVVPIVVVVVLILITLVLVILWKALKSSSNNTKWNKKQESIGGSRHLPSFHSNSRKFTYAELVTITNNFSKFIGKGGFGVVYHGIQNDGFEVAVKLLSHSSSQGAKQFQMEAQLLTKIHHKNLVPLVGYCNENNYIALVYEYMAGGSLQDHLLGSCRSMTLSWSDRLQIAVESAQGLEYLHKGCKPAIVHRDVKTNNILLTDKLEARVANFGLSKTFQNDAINPVSTTITGTLGYIDPEYYSSNQLNEKSDVYSFGVVLLELLTGRPAILKQEGSITLISWVSKRVARGMISDVVDPSIQGEYDINSTWKVVELALACTSSMSIKRPTMNDVLMLLMDCVKHLETHDVSRHKSKSTNQSDDNSIEVVPLNTSSITSSVAR